MSRRSIAIIGAGFSGATLAAQLLAGRTRTPRVLLIDRSGRFGPGLAYSTQNPAHLLNVRAATVSASPTRPSDFTDWLRFCDCEEAPEASFAQRATYGAYLETHVRRLARASDQGALTLLRDSVIACRPDESGVTVILSSGPPLRVDSAVLALGNQPAIAPAPFDQLPASEGRAVRDAWDGAALSRIRRDRDVLLLGTGMTMVDAVLALTATPRTGKIYALSRRGLTPQPHVQRPPEGRLYRLSLDEKLSEALPALRREIAATLARGEPWQTVFDRLRPNTAEYWRRLTPETQQRFLRHLRPWWDTHRHRTPPHIGVWLEALQTAGMLKVIAGRALEARATPTRFSVSYAPRGQRVVATLEVAQIVNCTGPCADIRRSADPLLQQMLRENIVAPHVTDLGFDVAEDGRVIDASGAAHTNLFALGPLMQGAFWEATAIPEIRAHAATLARTLLRDTLRISDTERALSPILTPAAALSFDASSL